MLKDNLGDRMKRYEYVSRTYLTPRTPVIIRVDGKAFHTFTRGFRRPFDDIFADAMQATMKYMCKNVQGCVLGYTQSDEITLVLVDYKEFDSQGWFDYNIQKCASVAASMATLAFNQNFREEASKMIDCLESKNCSIDEVKYQISLHRSVKMGAMFDARVFNVPREEVTNCVLWRQNDASRNSIQMLGLANFSQKEMQGKSCSEVQDMLVLQRGINWNDLPTKYKRGSCCIKMQQEGSPRPQWVIDNEIPIFKGDGREYIESLIYPDVTGAAKESGSD